MSKAKKLPSGTWRAMAYLGKDADGKKKYKSVTASTKKEAEYIAAMIALYRKDVKANITVMDALTAFLESRRNVISPSTEREYAAMIQRAYTSIERIKINRLSNPMIQKWINESAKTKSAKTIKNEFALLASALRIGDKIITLDQFRLPQQIKKEMYIPTEDDIKLILSLADGDYKVAVLLAAFGTMRRSEICALTPADLQGTIATVNKAMVKNEKREWVIKTTKTLGSTRKVLLPKFVADEFRRNGQLQKTPDAITRTHERMIKNAGIPAFRFHDYRHFSASILHALGMPDKYIMERGGWSSNRTLQNIYQHTIDSVTQAENDRVNDYFSNIIS